MLLKNLLLSAAWILFIGTVSGGDARILAEWSFQSGKIPPSVFFVESSGEKFGRVVNPGMKAPDGRPVLELSMQSVKPDSPAHAEQVNFYREVDFSASSRCRVEFWIRGTVAGEVPLNIARAQSPWTPLGKQSEVFRTLRITPEWQCVTVDFHPGVYRGAAALPRLLLARYPAGKLFIGTVRFFELPPQLPLTSGNEWQIFAGVKSDQVKLAAFDAVPATLPGETGPVSPRRAAMANDVLDLAELTGSSAPRRAAILFQEFDSPSAGIMQIGVGADWWMEFAVNGETVFSTLQGGNVAQNFRPEDHVFNFPVRQGRNLIAVRVLAGSGGWKFAAGKVPFRENPGALTQILPSPEWRPVNEENLAVRAGSALDLSALAERVPAGTYGRVIINPEGHTAFEQQPNRPVRFFAFNFGPPPPSEWSKEAIDEFADMTMRQGYNMVRIHYPERLWLDATRSRKWIGPKTVLPQNAKEIPFDRQGLDLFDYLVATLKKRGIYINLDCLSGYAGFTDTYTYYSPTPEYSFKHQLWGNERYRNNYRAGIQSILTRKNPYTGLKLADDPVLAVLNFFNEQEVLFHNPIGMKVLFPAWKQFLKERYGTVEALRKAWAGLPAESFDAIPPVDEKLLRTGDRASADAGDFIQEKMRELNDFYNGVVRETGYRGLTTQWDMIMRTLEIPARAMMPAIAQHTYFSHPSWRPPAPGTVKAHNQPDNDNRDMLIGQGSSLGSSYFRAAAATRFWGRPFLITEYSHSAPNCYRHERGLYFGSYAALQGWDALTAHARTIEKTASPITAFERGSDPVSRASEVVVAFAWLRGDVKTSPHSVELRLEKEKLFPENYLGAVGDEYAQLALLAGLGIRYPGVEPLQKTTEVRGDPVLSPDAFSPLEITTWYNSAATGYGNRFALLVKELRKKGILSASNRTDSARRLYESDTGEIFLDGQKQTMTVTSPRLEGAILKEDVLVALKNLKIVHCSQPASVAVISLDREKSLAESGRMLLVFATNALNSGMVFQTPTHIVDFGTLPILMRSAKLEIELTTNGTFECYALNLDGSRAEKLPVETSGGRLRFRIDTSRLAADTPFFEFVSVQK